MNEQLKTYLAEAGIDVKDVLERFMGNEALLERMLKRFTQSEVHESLEEAVKSRDAEAALAASHTLKGMTSNLSMSELTRLFTRQVELFRSGDAEAAYGLMDEITAEYRRMVRNILETPWQS